MKSYTAIFFPHGLMMLILAGATLFFGADTPVAMYFFSGVLLLLSALALYFDRFLSVPRTVVICFVLYAVFMLVDAFSGHIVGALPDYAALAAAGAVFLTARSLGRHSDYVRPAWGMLMAVFLLIAVWAFTDFVINPESIHGRPRPYHVGRLSAAFLSANTAATFFGVGLLVSAVGLLRALGRVSSFRVFDLVEGLFRHGAVSLITFLFCAICLVLTASRAGVAFAGISLFILFGWEVLSSRKGKGGIGMPAIALAGLALIAILAAGAWAMSGNMVAERYEDLGEDSNVRLVMFSAYWQAHFAHPFFGTGFGSFAEINNQVMTGENAHILSSQGAAHNVFLQWLLQKGWLGMLAMMGTIGLIVVRLFQGIGRRHRYRSYMRGCVVIALFVILHSQVDYAVEIPGFMWWWAFILGLGSGIAVGGHGKPSPARKGQAEA